MNQEYMPRKRSPGTCEGKPVVVVSTMLSTTPVGGPTCRGVIISRRDSGGLEMTTQEET